MALPMLSGLMIPSGCLPASGAESLESPEWFASKSVLLRLRPSHQQQGKTMETGHNSNAQLKSVVERIERINEDIKGLTDDRSDIFSEAKGNGFDTKALRKIIALRKLSSEDRAAQDQILETYMNALGMI
jgi:uncharacterized protein (UPF0335 family)